MDLEATGKLVAESLALQGRLESISKDKGELSVRLTGINKELERLEGVKKQKVSAENAFADLKVEEVEVLGQLNQRLAVLKELKVILPLGKVETSSQSVRL